MLSRARGAWVHVGFSRSGLGLVGGSVGAQVEGRSAQSLDEVRGVDEHAEVMVGQQLLAPDARVLEADTTAASEVLVQGVGLDSAAKALGEARGAAWEHVRGRRDEGLADLLYAAPGDA
jgi:hypothetical protein